MARVLQQFHQGDTPTPHTLIYASLNLGLSEEEPKPKPLSYTPREPWILDSRRFANKIKNSNYDPSEESQNSGITRKCPNCNHEINNNDLAQKWPGLPSGVKFDPSDQELLGHLAAQDEEGNAEPHPFIDEFIPTLGGEDGICYTHPEKLPGVKQDGSIRHFFHRTSNAYLRGNRKRRKINRGDDQSGVEVRWHKTGKTRPVIENGILRGWKKIMVLYMSNGKGERSEKTNWVIHQYHLGNEEDEKDGTLLVSKVFYQQQSKNSEKIEIHEEIEITSVTPGDPLTPITSTPEPPRHEKWHGDLDTVQEEQLIFMNNVGQVADFDMATHQANSAMDDLSWHRLSDQATERFEDSPWEAATLNDPTHYDSPWFAGESHLRTDSQQDFETLFCDENLQSSSSKGKMESDELDPALAENGRIEAEEIEPTAQASAATSCLDNIELDTPPDPDEMNLDLQYNSQESLSAWTKGVM